MSNYEHIFLHAGVPLEDLARELGEAVRGGSGRSTQSHLYVARPGRNGGEVGGTVAANILGSPPGTEPDERSVLDGYEVVFKIGSTIRDEQVQIDEARRLFDDITARLSYQVLLTQGLDLLVAAWSPTLGLTEFPPGTSVDAEDKDLWAPYDLPAFDPNT